MLQRQTSSTASSSLCCSHSNWMYEYDKVSSRFHNNIIVVCKHNFCSLFLCLRTHSQKAINKSSFSQFTFAHCSSSSLLFSVSSMCRLMSSEHSVVKLMPSFIFSSLSLILLYFVFYSSYSFLLTYRIHLLIFLLIPHFVLKFLDLCFLVVFWYTPSWELHLFIYHFLYHNIMKKKRNKR